MNKILTFQDLHQKEKSWVLTEKNTAQNIWLADYGENGVGTGKTDMSKYIVRARILFDKYGNCATLFRKVTQ